MGGRRVLVTGGAGFIGSHLCERLVTAGASVTVLDNLDTGRAANLAPLVRSGAPLRLVRGDVRAPIEAQIEAHAAASAPALVHGPALPATAGLDCIFHLACPASPAAYQRAPIDTVRTAVLGTLNVLECAQRQGAAVLIASTSEVYGDPEVHPQREDYAGAVNPTGPRACYDEGKRCAETLATEFARQRGLRVRIARIFNTYGPRMQPDDGRVVSNFIAQALTGRDLTVYGDGRQTRSLCYVDDLVGGLVALLDADAAGHAPVNLGNPAEVSVLKIAEAVLYATGSRSRIAFKPLPADDPRRRRPDITRAQQLLGWSPAVPLQDGLARTVQWFARALATPTARTVPAA